MENAIVFTTFRWDLKASQAPTHPSVHLFHLMFLHEIKVSQTNICYSYKHPPESVSWSRPHCQLQANKVTISASFFFFLSLRNEWYILPYMPQVNPFLYAVGFIFSNSIWGIGPLLSTFFFLWKFQDMLKTFILKTVLSGSLCLLSCQCLPYFFLFGICQFTII